jgi:uncharacterized protein (DUF736 family)
MQFRKAYVIARTRSAKDPSVFYHVIANVECMDGKCTPDFRVETGGKEFGDAPKLEIFEAVAASFVNGDEWGF